MQLPLPLTPKQLLEAVIIPTLLLLGPKYDNRVVRILLLAIAMQESGLRYRAQVGGPARGLWEFELNGVHAVILNGGSTDLVLAAAEHFGLPCRSDALQPALAENDVLACWLARALLWDDPRPLPANEQDAFEYYHRNWRPGAYDRGTQKQKDDVRARWSANYKTACATVPLST